MQAVRLSRQDYDRAKQLAEQDWCRYLTGAGLLESQTKGRMGPCPICGGNTRFYMRRGKSHLGLGWCHACGPMDGWQILQGLLGSDFSGAVSWLLDHHGGAANQVAPRTPTPSRKAEPDDATVRAKYEKLWAEGKPIRWGSESPAARYLAWRAPGLGFVPDALREHPALEYWTLDANDEPTSMGRFPALIARVTGPKGELANIWRIYLSPEGKKAPVPEPKKAAGRFLAQGAAVRLGESVNGRLGVAEGIEGALAAMVMGGPPTWACCFASMLKGFVLPEGLQVNTLTIYGDNDSPDRLGRRAGNEAARTLRDRVKEMGKKAFVVFPASTDYDIGDLAMKESSSPPA